MLKIYGPARSRASRSLWMAEEIGLPYEHIDFAGMETDERNEVLTGVNPMAKVPAIEDGDLKLFESMAINLYLAEQYGTELWPDNEPDRARTVQWSVFAMTEIEPPLVQLFLERVIHTDENRDKDNEAKALNDLARPMKVLDVHLEGQDHLLGDKFSTADLNLASIFTLGQVARYDMVEYPNVADWANRCLGRPAYKRVR
ncbi:MAG: glutathione S-transferase family protein [Pseudomonadota bacterium]|nr:glutathione S-transferase family protein [Pseudomonadota bacterium]